LIDKDSYDLEALKPIWLPYTKETETVCEAVMADLHLLDIGSTGKKHLLMVASLLKAIARVQRRSGNEFSTANNRKACYLGVSRTAANWSNYPMIGREIALQVLDRFIATGWLTKVDGSGDRGFEYNEDQDRWTANPTMSLYKLDETEFVKKAAGEEKYIQVGRPLITVNQAEARGQRKRRKKFRLAKPVLKPTEAKSLFAGSYKSAEDGVKDLNEFWRKHPLQMPDGNAAACATRVYHDGRIDAGGRFYGLWTNQDGSVRLQATIDGEPVCEIDIKGSQPTLLSSLLGVKLNGVSDHGTWYDVYTQITGLWSYGATDEGIFDPMKNPDTVDPMVRIGSIAKGVIMEIIGTGNVNKDRPSSEFREKHSVTQEEWDYCKAKLIEAIPALKQLEPRYGATGNLEGYINGPGFLSYHESEMILATIKALHTKEIPAYPVHDCLIIKSKDVDLGVETLRGTVHDYCQHLSGIRVLVPVTVEDQNGRMPYPYDSNPDALRGEYL